MYQIHTYPMKSIINTELQKEGLLKLMEFKKITLVSLLSLSFWYPTKNPNAKKSVTCAFFQARQSSNIGPGNEARQHLVLQFICYLAI